jgi:uncharacterized protein YdaT
MPWDAQSFATKHNKKLVKRPAAARQAAKQANAMLKKGVPEGVAIATANKRANNKTANTKRKQTGIINQSGMS